MKRLIVVGALCASLTGCGDWCPIGEHVENGLIGFNAIVVSHGIHGKCKLVADTGTVVLLTPSEISALRGGKNSIFANVASARKR